jgi:hypothetical protein
MATLSRKNMKLPLSRTHIEYGDGRAGITPKVWGHVNEFPSPVLKREKNLGRDERWQHFAAASVNRMDLMGRNVDYPGRTLIPISPRSGVSISLFRLLREISHGAERKTFPIRPPSPPPHRSSSERTVIKPAQLFLPLFIFNSDAFDLK